MEGIMKRDFTYVDDIVNAVVAVSDSIPHANPKWDSANPDPSSSSAPYRVFNIGNHQSVDLLHFISVLEKAIGKKAIINLMPMQAVDVPNTYADIQSLNETVGYVPTTSIEVGVPRFVDWYREYYNI